MDQVTKEMIAALGFDIDTENSLAHYGMPRRSGRYPWGSGDDPYQHSNDFLGRVEQMRKDGFTYTDEKGVKYTGDKAIYKSLGLTSSQFRTEIGVAKDTRRMYDVATAKRLRDKEGKNPTEIGRIMGKNESTIRSLLNDNSEARMKKARETADAIKKMIKEKGMIDVTSGVERELNISREKFNQALYLLEKEGYPIYKGGIPQATNPGKQTNQKVICPKGTEHKEIYNYDKVNSLNDYISRDDGKTLEKKFHYPESLDSKRLSINYAEDGGIEKDGIIELRRGVPDLSLGESRYSQVRIMVDGTHYLKGMAVYADDLPKGVDVRFNTNKKRGTPMEKVLKEIKPDPDNPFGSLIKDADKGGQYWYDSKTGEKWNPDKPVGEKKLGLINKRADEGDWTEWADALPAQFLAKQSKYMAKKQLGLAVADKTDEFNDICSLTNPTIKKHLLNKFADQCDSAAVDLKAAALPRQKYNVIIPFPTLKDTEVYAPQYEEGTKLALVRYPHGGTFEIPILTVTHRNRTARKLLGTDITDAVGINSKVAERLSGADFDGDTVMCIPTHDREGKVKITNREPLKGLEGFDPKDKYPYREGMKVMAKKSIQQEMGMISNLITDMTLQGASDDELAAAVRHSMVVIDAYKHKLDYKQSEVDNNISALHKKYQGHYDENGRWHDRGAATLISKSKGQATVIKRQGTPKVNMPGKEWYDPSRPEGSLIYKEASDAYYPIRKYDKKTKDVTLTTVDGKKITYNVEDKTAAAKYAPVKRVDEKTGDVSFTNEAGDIVYKTKPRTQKSTNMIETDDARTLMSGRGIEMEEIYADYANTMKSMANNARKEMMITGKIEYNAKSKAKYADEVSSLNSKLNDALKNAPRERAAQRAANAEVQAKKLENPNMESEDIKKASQQALTKYRSIMGSVSRRDRNINITDSEWDAIQEGAISENTLKKILDNTDIDALRQRAMPKTTNVLSESKVNRIKNLNDSNYSIAEIARKVGCSVSVVSNCLKGKK